jgi:hypothetical protein
MGRSVCITGQLYILELAIRYLEACPSVHIIQLNTDGIMISIEEAEMSTIYAINDEWQQSKHLILEEDRIEAVFQKDVNNYVMVKEGGSVKTKGAYVTWGIPGGGAFKINNDFVIVKQAVVDYFTKGTPVEETIGNCDDIKKFMVIAKAGGGYRSVYQVPADFEERKKQWQKDNRHRVISKNDKFVWKSPTMLWDNYDGPRNEIQRVNRVYSSIVALDLPTIMKVKPDGTVGRIGNLPDNCIIDNKNELTMNEIDKGWYVSLARKYIEDYTGVSLS